MIDLDLAPRVGLPKEGEPTTKRLILPNGRTHSTIRLIETPPQLLVCLAALQISFSSHSLCSVDKGLKIDQFPRTASAGPATFVFLVLVHTFPKVRSEANVEPTLWVLQDVDKVPSCIHDRFGFGSPGRTRTYNQAVNSRPLYH